METVPEMFGSMVFDDRDMRARLSQEVYQSLRKTIEELSARLEGICSVQGYDILDMFNTLCDKIIETAPPSPRKSGARPKDTVGNRYKMALDALERLSGQSEGKAE